MNLVFWLALCVTVVVAAGRRAHVPLLLVPIVWVLVPWVAAPAVSGFGASPTVTGTLHPGSWLVIVIAAVTVLTRPIYVLSAVRAHRGPMLVVAGFVVLAIGSTLARGTVQGLASVVYLVVIPATYAVLAISEHRDNPSFAVSLRRVILILAAFQSALGVCQYIAGRSIFYEPAYAVNYWWVTPLERAIGTMDHPLMLSLLLAAAMPLSIGLRSGVARALLPALFFFAILLTGSRTGAVIASMILVWVATRGRASLAARALMLGGVGAMATMLVAGSMAPTLFSRFENDAGSSRVRLEVYSFFWEILPDYLFVGAGASGNYKVLAHAGIESSFESTLFAYVVDYGALGALAYFASLVTLAWRLKPGAMRAIPGGELAAGVACLVVFTYSGGSVQSTAMSLVWTFVALSSFSLPAEVADSDAPVRTVSVYRRRRESRA